MNKLPPKYSLPEIERRWLVDPALLKPLGVPAAHILDRYIKDGNLRLRRLATPTETLYKLCKKYPSNGAWQNITNLYLDQTEYEMLLSIPAIVINKTRFKTHGGAVDVYGNDALFIFEKEFLQAEDAVSYLPPNFTTREVTGDRENSGYALAQRFGAETP